MSEMLIAAPSSTPPPPRHPRYEGEAKGMTMNPVGPVAQRFVEDRRFITNIMGPYGSGKTTTCFQKIIMATLWQNVNPRTGMRHSRGMVMRATYGQLVTNVLADWHGWFAKTKANWNGEDMRSTLVMFVIGFGRIKIDVLFRACDNDEDAEALLKGVNLTWLWLNEIDTLRASVLKFGRPRVGRYPGTRDGGCAWAGIFSDMNAPDVDNWTYDLLVNQDDGLDDELRAEFAAKIGPDYGIGFHKQPGGRAPGAENLENLRPGYYEQMMVGMAAGEVRRFIDNQFGAVRYGQPVYPEFIDEFHVAREGLRALPDVAITIGFDGGATPAAVLLQRDASGQIRVLDEIVLTSASEDEALVQMGPESFANEIRRVLTEKYPKASVGNIWGDPAAGYGDVNEEKSFMSEFSKAFGKKARAAKVPGNRITPRLEAVRTPLKTNCGGGPGLLVSSSCKMLRRGFNSGYVYERMKSSATGSKVLKDKPTKTDPSSHVHDALQYGVFMLQRVGNGLAAMDRERGERVERARKRKNVQFSGYSGGRS